MNLYSICSGQQTGRTGYFKRKHGRVKMLMWMFLVLCLTLPVKTQAAERAVTVQAGILTEEEIQELTRQAEELEQDTGVYESEYPEDTKEAADDQEERRSITDTELLIAAVAALAAGGITAGNIIVKYRLRFGGYRYPVEKNGNLNLRIQEDRLVNQFVKKRDISK